MPRLADAGAGAGALGLAALTAALGRVGGFESEISGCRLQIVGCGLAAAAVCWCRVAAPFDPPSRPRNPRGRHKLLAKLLQPEKRDGARKREGERASEETEITCKLAARNLQLLRRLLQRNINQRMQRTKARATAKK